MVLIIVKFGEIPNALPNVLFIKPYLGIFDRKIQNFANFLAQ